MTGPLGLFLRYTACTMSAVRIQITRYTNDHNPGFVECRLTDAWGKEWLFEVKVPVVAYEELDDRSDYPQPGVFHCEIVNTRTDENGREIVTIDIEKPWGIESVDGSTQFEILGHQLTETWFQ